jgi:hypothetical protein
VNVILFNNLFAYDGSVEAFFKHLPHSHNYPTSNLTTGHSDIYRGNGALTLFDPIYSWKSYREACCLPDAEFAQLPENRSISGISRLFTFHP